MLQLYLGEEREKGSLGCQDYVFLNYVDKVKNYLPIIGHTK